MRFGALTSEVTIDLSAVAAPVGESWFTVTTSIATLIAALGAVGAILVGVSTVRQRTAADARSQWWSRVQWAVDLTLEPDPARRTVGFDALELLARSPLAGPGDAAFLSGLSLGTLSDVQRRGEGSSYEIVGERAGRPSDAIASQARHASARVPVTRDEVAAARLRVATDALEHASTPVWIEALARTPAGVGTER